jgi:hypothetical protein
VRREKNQRGNVATRRSTASFMEAPPPAPTQSSENSVSRADNAGSGADMNDNPLRNKRGI